MLFGIAVKSGFVGITIRRKCFGRYRDLRINIRIIRMRCHDLRVWKSFEVLGKYVLAVEELQSQWIRLYDGNSEGLVHV